MNSKTIGDARPPLTESLSVVVPVFNNASTLRELTGRLARVLPAAASRYELVFVDDGSEDDGWATIESLTREYPWVRGVALARNSGQHIALLCGIRHARYDVIATMDDDLQNPPEELPRLLSQLTSDADLVYGVPTRRYRLWRGLASRLIRMALRPAIGRDAARAVSQYRVFRTRLRNAFADYRSPLVSIDVLLMWGTHRFVSLPVETAAGTRRRSSYTLAKLLGVALDLLTGFSILPLRLVTVIGFGFTLLGVVVLAYVLIRYFIAPGGVPGFPFLASIIAVFAGAQLFALGIIGEYLGRTFLRTMGNPSYVVHAVVSGGVTTVAGNEGAGAAR